MSLVSSSPSPLTSFDLNEDELLQHALHLSRLEAEARKEEDRKFAETVADSLQLQLQRAVSQDDGDLCREEFDVTDVFQLLTKYGGERLRLLGLDLGVRLLLKHEDGSPMYLKRGRKRAFQPHGRVLMEMEGTRTALTVAVPEFQTKVLDSTGDYEAEVLARWNENVFVIADNSNIFISAQYQQDGGERDPRVRLSVPRLCDVVCHGRHPRKRFVAGSHGGSGELVWKAAYENEGFTTYVEDRRLPTFNENAVDDILHAQAMSVLAADYGGGELSQTLVLLTGDGNGNDGRTSFPSVVREFMKQNADRQATNRPPLWKVEIVTWRRSLSQKMTMLQEEYPGYVSIRYLDEHRDYVTYTTEHGGPGPHGREVAPGVLRSGNGSHKGAGSRWQWIDDDKGGPRHERRQSKMESSSVSAGDHEKCTHKDKDGKDKGTSRWQWVREEKYLGQGGKGQGRGGIGATSLEEDGVYVWPQQKSPQPQRRFSHAHARGRGNGARL